MSHKFNSVGSTPSALSIFLIPFGDKMVNEINSSVCEFEKLQERKDLHLLELMNEKHSQLLLKKDFENATILFSTINMIRSQFYPV